MKREDGGFRVMLSEGSIHYDLPTEEEGGASEWVLAKIDGEDELVAAPLGDKAPGVQPIKVRDMQLEDAQKNLEGSLAAVAESAATGAADDMDKNGAHMAESPRRPIKTEPVDAAETSMADTTPKSKKEKRPTPTSGKAASTASGSERKTTTKTKQPATAATRRRKQAAAKEGASPTAAPAETRGRKRKAGTDEAKDGSPEAMDAAESKVVKAKRGRPGGLPSTAEMGVNQTKLSFGTSGDVEPGVQEEALS